MVRLVELMNSRNPLKAGQSFRLIRLVERFALRLKSQSPQSGAVFPTGDILISPPNNRKVVAIPSKRGSLSDCYEYCRAFY